jgi:hypothetical protein
MGRTKQTVYDYARANLWEWFVTITYDPNKVNRYSYEETGRKLSNWLDNVRKRKAPDLKYIIVPELHDDGAWHFHGLLSNVGELRLIDSGHKTKGMNVYNLPDWQNGFTTATKVQDSLRASNYITKYITKDLVNHTKGQKRYWNSKNLLTGEVEKAMVDSAGLLAIQDAYTKTAKRTKKIVVAANDYQTEIMYFTVECDKESVPNG